MESRASTINSLRRLVHYAEDLNWLPWTVLIVNGSYAALIAVSSSDLIGTVPLHFAEHLATFLT